MKSTLFVNNISDKLKSEIPVLKPGDRKLFQMLHGVPNPEPDEKERSKNPVLYGKRQVQTNFRIFDPYQKNKEGKEVGGWADVGAVEQWDGDKPIRYKMFVPGMGMYSQFQGKFELSADKIEDQELFEVLWLSNEREGNPHRDKSVEPLFKIVDAKADSKRTVSKVESLRKALNTCDSISEKDARKVMAALNQPTFQDKDVLMGKLKEFAMNNHEVFNNTYSDPDTETKATIKEAIDAGVLAHDIMTGNVTMEGVNIVTMKLADKAELINALTNWVKTSENGKDVLENVKNQMSKKPEVI